MVDFAVSRHTLLSFIGNIFLEIIAPTFCCHCGKIGLLLCEKCFTKIAYTPFPNLIADTNKCFAVFTVAQYAGPIRSLIISMKFAGVKAVCNYLADLTTYAAQLPDFDIICPVPLHPKRKQERGFDQVELIAKRLAQNYQKPFVPLLIRTKHLTAQSSISDKAQRLARMSQIYEINPKYAQKIRELKEMKILLVDDVFTTGATIRTAAQALHAHNQHFAVIGLCVARD